MRVTTEFPHQVREVQHTWITLSDGCRLSARLWLPEGAEEHPVPAILEYLPYRKNDGTALRDAVHHPYFAGHGYVSVRVDMRGTGDSDGILYDEYLPQEQLDALEILSWLEDQPWCTGRVGIIGISWGGFNGLQIASWRPPQLQAVVSLCSTDDRYADDVHYMGGCLLGAQSLPWASSMLVRNASPPDPRHVGESWRQTWLDRMERTPPFVEAWLSHQRRDDFWKQGSICEDFSQVNCPVFAVGGWADAYTNAVPRLLEGLQGPKKGLIGPWVHLYPEQAVPEPTIGFMQECVRWWDHWLKDVDTGIMDEPLLRVWMQDAVPPQRSYASSRPGRWVSEGVWPSANITAERLHLSHDGLASAPGDGRSFDVQGMQTTGLHAGTWCPSGKGPEFPGDQRAEAGGMLAFTSEPLTERLEILGAPEVSLRLRADQPHALVAAVLCDVAPSGESTLVTRGLLNLAHRDSHENPSSLEPGDTYDVRLRLNDIAHGWPRQHRLQLLVSPTYWTWAWPSPSSVTLSVQADSGSFIELPVRRRPEQDDEWPGVKPAEGAPPLEVSPLGGTHDVQLRYDLGSGTSEREVRRHNGYRNPDDGLEYESHSRDLFTIVDGDPLSATVQCDRSLRIARAEWDTLVETTSTMSSTETSFIVTNTVTAFERNIRVFAKSWEKEIPRDHV